MKVETLCSISLLLFALACSSNAQTNDLTIKSFEECVHAGNAIKRSMPPSCTTANGQTFYEQSEISAPKAICKASCGDGECQEIVCMGAGCPCPESTSSCPQDCKT